MLRRQPSCRHRERRMFIRQGDLAAEEEKGKKKCVWCFESLFACQRLNLILSVFTEQDKTALSWRDAVRTHNMICLERERETKGQPPHIQFNGASKITTTIPKKVVGHLYFIKM